MSQEVKFSPQGEGEMQWGIKCLESHNFYHRNLQKRAKTARHEAEKAHMEDRRSVGIATGQYQGNGQGEEENVCDFEEDPFFSDGEDMAASDTVDQSTHPLLFMFDIETTGLHIYEDAITDIAAKVVNIPVNSVSQPTFSSLVMTSKSIPAKGIGQLKLGYCKKMVNYSIQANRDSIY